MQFISPFSFTYPVVWWTVGAPQMTWQPAPSIPLASQPYSWRCSYFLCPSYSQVMLQICLLVDLFISALYATKYVKTHQFEASVKNSSGDMRRGVHNIVLRLQHLLCTLCRLAHHFTPGNTVIYFPLYPLQLCPTSCPTSPEPQRPCRLRSECCQSPRPHKGAPPTRGFRPATRSKSRKCARQRVRHPRQLQRFETRRRSNSTTLGAVLPAVASLRPRRFSRNPFSR